MENQEVGAEPVPPERRIRVAPPRRLRAEPWLDVVRAARAARGDDEEHDDDSDDDHDEDPDEDHDDEELQGVNVDNNDNDDDANDANDANDAAKTLAVCSRPVRMLLWRKEDSEEVRFREVKGTILINSHREPIQICGVDESKTLWHINSYTGVSMVVHAARPVFEPPDGRRKDGLLSYNIKNYIKNAREAGICVIFAIKNFDAPLGTGRCALYEPIDLPRTHRVYDMLKNYIDDVDFDRIESAKTLQLVQKQTQHRGAVSQSLEKAIVDRIYTNMNLRVRSDIARRLFNGRINAYSMEDRLQVIKNHPASKRRYERRMSRIRRVKEPAAGATDLDFD